ncbi:hypothetical protein ABH924_004346 [Arthrobacter sp. GAS37]|uniref:hypothetical protein n=1 Tax=Arthrobacter sp. GAS37 TaxID=3156261 RepID=UPI003838F0C6
MNHLTRMTIDLATAAGTRAHLALNSVLPAEITNPLGNVSPDLTIFGGKINLGITLLLGFAWALCSVAAIFMIFSGLGAARHAQKRSNEPEKVTAGLTQAKTGGLVLALSFALPIIIGGIIIFVNRVNSGA